MANYLGLSKDFVLGDTVENFTLLNLKGEKVELDFFSGKYVYLDFWASGCGPCRVLHRGLAKLYKKYKDKGLEIISISLDNHKTQWEKAVEKDNMTWTNLFDPEGFKGDVALTYKIFTVFISFFINPHCKVISRYYNGNHDLEKRLKDSLNN